MSCYFFYILLYDESLPSYGRQVLEALGVARREPQSGLVRAVWPQKGLVLQRILGDFLGFGIKA